MKTTAIGTFLLALIAASVDGAAPGATDLVGDLLTRFGPTAGLAGYLLWWLRAKDAQAREDAQARDKGQLERLDKIVDRLDRLADRTCPYGRTAPAPPPS